VLISVEGDAEVPRGRDDDRGQQRPPVRREELIQRAAEWSSPRAAASGAISANPAELSA